MTFYAEDNKGSYFPTEDFNLASFCFNISIVIIFPCNIKIYSSLSRLNRIIDACFQAKTGQIVKLFQNMSAIKEDRASDMTVWHSLNSLLASCICRIPSEPLGSHLTEPRSGGQVLAGSGMTSADQAGSCGVVVGGLGQLRLVVRKDFGNKGKSWHPQHQTIICVPTMFHNNKPNWLEEEEMKVSGKFFFFFFSGDIKMVVQFQNKRANERDRYVILQMSFFCILNEGNHWNKYIIRTSVSFADVCLKITEYHQI